MEETKSIALLGNATKMLAEVQTIDDAKQLMDIAASAKLYARKHKLGKEAVDYAHSIEVQAEIKLGEILAVMEKNKGAAINAIIKADSVMPPTLPELGISANLSSEAQALASLTEEEKTRVVKGKQSKRKAIASNKKDRQREQKATDGKNINVNVDFRLGDFEDVLDNIPDGSVDCIITDPPYPYEFIECWTKLSKFARKKLKPNGFCIAYSGQFNLPEVIKRMGEHLDYYWTFAVYHEGTTQIVNAVNLMCRWKPVLIYQNGKKKIDNTFQDYFISEQREKDGHDWQQSKSGVSYLIEMFTKPGDLIVEPFTGSGTTIIAAINLKRNIIGAEIDESVYNIAKSNIHDQTKE